MCKPVPAVPTTTKNILLKVTVPRRTGRKRKRGSPDTYDEVPLEGEIAPGTTASLARQDDPQYLLRSMRDNVAKYKVEAVGEIWKTYRFRGSSVL